MRSSVLFFLGCLCALSLPACAGGNTGLALGYGHHGPGIAVYTDNLWYTPHRGGVSVPLGWESGSYSHVPYAAPAAPAVSAAVPLPSTGAPSGDAAPVGQPSGLVPGQLPGQAPVPSPAPSQKSASPEQPGPDGPAPRLGETPAVLEPPDLSYRP